MASKHQNNSFATEMLGIMTEYLIDHGSLKEKYQKKAEARALISANKKGEQLPPKDRRQIVEVLNNSEEKLHREIEKKSDAFVKNTKKPTVKDIVAFLQDDLSKKGNPNWNQIISTILTARCVLGKVDMNGSNKYKILNQFADIAMTCAGTWIQKQGGWLGIVSYLKDCGGKAKGKASVDASLGYGFLTVKADTEGSVTCVIS